jgi:hypothetical protein
MLRKMNELMKMNRRVGAIRLEDQPAALVIRVTDAPAPQVIMSAANKILPCV